MLWLSMYSCENAFGVKISFCGADKNASTRESNFKKTSWNAWYYITINMKEYLLFLNWYINKGVGVRGTMCWRVIDTALMY